MREVLCFRDGDSPDAYRYTTDCIFECFVAYVLQIQVYAFLFGFYLIKYFIFKYQVARLGQSNLLRYQQGPSTFKLTEGVTWESISFS